MSTDNNKAHSRWTDNPFREPNLPPERLKWLEMRNEATRIFHETGDDTMAIEIGLFPPHKAEGDTEGVMEDKVGQQLHKAQDTISKLKKSKT